MMMMMSDLVRDCLKNWQFESAFAYAQASHPSGSTWKALLAAMGRKYGNVGLFYGEEAKFVAYVTAHLLEGPNDSK
jgi:hypothetical protein